jgi:hypothetical protein
MTMARLAIEDSAKEFHGVVVTTAARPVIDARPSRSLCGQPSTVRIFGLGGRGFGKHPGFGILSTDQGLANLKN